MLKTLILHVIYWYHLYVNLPGVSILANIIRRVCYWKFFVNKVELCSKSCDICQWFKNCKTCYGLLPPKNISELKPWDFLHMYLIVPYTKSIIQHHPGVAIIQKDGSLTCMKIINPVMGWFEIFEAP